MAEQSIATYSIRWEGSRARNFRCKARSTLDVGLPTGPATRPIWNGGVELDAADRRQRPDLILYRAAGSIRSAVGSSGAEAYAGSADARVTGSSPGAEKTRKRR